MLGKLEEIVLLGVIHAGRKATAAVVYEEIDTRLDEKISFGAVYTTLDRMLDKNFLQAKDGPIVRGKPRKLYEITGVGQLALKESMNVTERMNAPALAGMAGA